MARNGSGTMVRVMDWTDDAAAGVNITASRMDTEFDDIATEISRSIASDGQTTVTADISLASHKLTGLSNGTARTHAVNLGQLQDGGLGYRADCRLIYTNATTLTLNRKNGDRLCINGVNVQIPAAGVTLSNGGLAADTTYNIYAFMSGSTMTLEASTTAHAEDSATGVEIKSGAATRTLVGKVRTNGSSNFVQSSTTLAVLTWFNRRLKRITQHFTADRTTASTSYTEINSEIRLPFLCWEDGDVFYAVRGAADNNTASGKTYTAVGIDTGGSVTVRGGTAVEQPSGSANQYLNASLAGYEAEVEGFHYATVMGKVGVGTGTWKGGAAVVENDITLVITVFG